MCIRDSLKDEYEEFSQEYRVKELLRRYSNFVGFPINFNGEHINTCLLYTSRCV